MRFFGFGSEGCEERIGSSSWKLQKTQKYPLHHHMCLTHKPFLRKTCQLPHVTVLRDYRRAYKNHKIFAALYKKKKMPARSIHNDIKVPFLWLQLLFLNSLVIIPLKNITLAVITLGNIRIGNPPPRSSSLVSSRMMNHWIVPCDETDRTHRTRNLKKIKFCLVHTPT